MSPSLPHAAGPRSERQDVAGPPEVVGGGILIAQHAAGEGAVVRADARRYGGVGGIDRDGVGRPAKVLAPRHHLRELEVDGALRRDWRADQPGAVPDHEGHLFRRDVLRGDDQVGLVLATGIVEDDDEFPISCGAGSQPISANAPPLLGGGPGWGSHTEGLDGVRNRVELRPFNCGAWHVDVEQADQKRL